MLTNIEINEENLESVELDYRISLLKAESIISEILS